MLDILRAQELLRQYDCDAWLIYSFRLQNPFVRSLLNPPSNAVITRRWIYCIPANEPPIKIIHRIEVPAFDWLQCDALHYTRQQDWESILLWIAQRYRKIAVEYSPRNHLPSVSYADAGFVEILKSAGAVVVSSADLLQHFTAILSKAQIEENRTTAQTLRSIIHAAFTYIGKEAKERSVTEYEVQQFIIEQFRNAKLTTDHPPIVATTRNAANPHYVPEPHNTATIQPGDLILIDAWAKPLSPESIYADLTWMAYFGTHIPERYTALFQILVDARSAVLDLLQSRLQNGTPVYGYELDIAARTVIEKAGYGKFFIHRTGHNIYTDPHGPGTNLDSFETHDYRQIIPRTSFSIEPGIYIPGDVGMRTEINVIIDEKNAIQIFSEPIQMEIVTIADND